MSSFKQQMDLARELSSSVCTRSRARSRAQVKSYADTTPGSSEAWNQAYDVSSQGVNSRQTVEHYRAHGRRAAAPQQALDDLASCMAAKRRK